MTSKQMTRRSKRIPKVLSERELALLLAAPNRRSGLGLRDRAAIVLMSYLGLRNEEITRLRRYNLHLEEEQPWLFIEESKYDRDRVLPVPPLVVDALRAWLEVAPRSEYVFCTVKRAGGVAAGRPHGSQLSTNGIRELVAKYARKAELERHVHPHMLRHTAATRLLRQPGATIDDVSRFLGHADTQTTLVYTHTSSSELARLVAGLR